MEEIQNVFQRIGIDGERYEEYFITDYECYVDDIYNSLGEYESLDELNYLANLIENMDEWDFARFEGAIAYGEYTNYVKDFINLAQNLDCYEVMPEIEDEWDLGHYNVHDAGLVDLSALGNCSNYFDYESYGRDIAMDENGNFTDNGYVYNGRSDFYEYYNGDRKNIPEEYIISHYIVREDENKVEIEAEPINEMPNGKSNDFER